MDTLSIILTRLVLLSTLLGVGVAVSEIRGLQTQLVEQDVAINALTEALNDKSVYIFERDGK